MTRGGAHFADKVGENTPECAFAAGGKERACCEKDPETTRHIAMKGQDIHPYETRGIEMCIYQRLWVSKWMGVLGDV